MPRECYSATPSPLRMPSRTVYAGIPSPVTLGVDLSNMVSTKLFGNVVGTAVIAGKWRNYSISWVNIGGNPDTPPGVLDRLRRGKVEVGENCSEAFTFSGLPTTTVGENAASHEGHRSFFDGETGTHTQLP